MGTGAERVDRQPAPAVLHQGHTRHENTHDLRVHVPPGQAPPWRGGVDRDDSDTAGRGESGAHQGQMPHPALMCPSGAPTRRLLDLTASPRQGRCLSIQRGSQPPSSALAHGRGLQPTSGSCPWRCPLGPREQGQHFSTASLPRSHPHGWRVAGESSADPSRSTHRAPASAVSAAFALVCTQLAATVNTEHRSQQCRRWHKGVRSGWLPITLGFAATAAASPGRPEDQCARVRAPWGIPHGWAWLQPLSVDGRSSRADSRCSTGCRAVATYRVVGFRVAVNRPA